MNLSPDQMLEYAQRMAKEMLKVSRGSVKVGLIASKVSGQIYGNGQTVLEVGFVHEYGVGNSPQRSFLRTPFKIKKKELAAQIDTQLLKVLSGKQSAEKGLGLIGAYATNISKGAFRTQGYGTWPALKPSTIKEKGSSQILIDTGTLRNSISWEVKV